MQELIKGLRGDLIDCECNAYSASECGCGCTWPSDVAGKAADLIESQAAEIASIQETLNAVAKVASDAENLVISQRDEIEKYKALCDQMVNALKTLWLAAPTDVDCNNMSHPKPKQHRYDETCPLVGEYHDAITGAGKALKAWRSMK